MVDGFSESAAATLASCVASHIDVMVGVLVLESSGEAVGDEGVVAMDGV